MHNQVIYFILLYIFTQRNNQYGHLYTQLLSKIAQGLFGCSLTLLSDLDIVSRSNSAVISVPPTLQIRQVDLTQKVHRLTLHGVNIFQFFRYVDVPSWGNQTVTK